MHPSAQKVADAAQKLGLAIEIKEFEQTTRSAQEAADAIGCELAQIVKSLCFTVNDAPIMALVSGANQLDERKLAALCGVGRKKVQRASADAVKAATGFSIGGVPPFGHLTPMTIFVDEDLRQFGTVWAAAGTPFAVFAIGPEELVEVCGGTAVSLKKSNAISMAKRVTFSILILISLASLWSGIQFYRRQLETLQSRGLDGPVFIGLIILGISVLLMPIHLRMTWEKWSAWGLVREYAVRFGLIIGTLLAIFVVFGLIVLLITLPERLERGYLILPWLTVLVPLVMVIIDLVQQNIKRTAQNFVAGFGLYAFRIYGLLLIQFVTIPIAFVLFPAGFFLQLLSLGDLVARWGFGVFVAERPLLCEWFNLLDSCTPGLISLHVGHLILALLAAKFGPTLFDQASTWYRNSLESIQGLLETP